MNKVVIDFLKNSGGSADTFRLQNLAYPAGSSFATPTTATTSITNGSTTVAAYAGAPLGAVSSYSTTTVSPIGAFQIQAPLGTRAGMLMLLAESKFLRAEYTERYGVTFGGLTAQTLYEQGIRDHFRTVAAPSTAGNVANGGDVFAIRYYNRPAQNISYVASTDKIKAILLQKWISLTHINGLEQWSEYRKASGSGSEGVPASVKTTASVTTPEPARYVYPQTEFDNNGLNLPKNINRFTSKIFWDVN